MKREKWYFGDENAASCYPVWVFASVDWELESEGSTKTLIEAIPDREQRGCRIFGSIWIDREDSPCSRACVSYSPCNGKSGACRSLTHGYTKGEQVTFRLDAGEWKEVKNGK